MFRVDQRNYFIHCREVIPRSDISVLAWSHGVSVGYLLLARWMLAWGETCLKISTCRYSGSGPLLLTRSQAPALPSTASVLGIMWLHCPHGGSVP